ncbi:MAG: NEL-type E3 ubiquitin ligase domain-containing protein [Pseudomonadota bacterium]
MDQETQAGSSANPESSAAITSFRLPNDLTKKSPEELTTIYQEIEDIHKRWINDPAIDDDNKEKAGREKCSEKELRLWKQLFRDLQVAYKENEANNLTFSETFKTAFKISKRSEEQSPATSVGSKRALKRISSSFSGTKVPVKNPFKKHEFTFSVSTGRETLSEPSPTIFSLPGLTTFAAPQCFLKRIGPDIANAKELKNLNLSYNLLQSLPAEIGNLPSLKDLTLSANDISALPPEMEKLKLDTLTVVNNRIPAFPRNIKSWHPDTQINIGGNPMDERVILHLENVREEGGPNLTYDWERSGMSFSATTDPNSEVTAALQGNQAALRDRFRFAADLKRAKPLSEAITEWVPGLSDDKKTMWDDIGKEDANAQAFSRCLERIKETADYKDEDTRPMVIIFVGELLKQMETDEKLRKEIFSYAVQSLGTCADRVANSFEQMVAAYLNHIAVAENAPLDERLELGTCMGERQVITDTAKELMTTDEFKGSDQIEVELACKTEIARKRRTTMHILWDKLKKLNPDLPPMPKVDENDKKRMLYFASSGIKPEHVELIEKRIETFLEGDAPALTTYLATQNKKESPEPLKCWGDLLKKENKTEFKAVKKSFEDLDNEIVIPWEFDNKESGIPEDAQERFIPFLKAVDNEGDWLAAFNTVKKVRVDVKSDLRIRLTQRLRGVTEHPLPLIESGTQLNKHLKPELNDFLREYANGAREDVNAVCELLLKKQPKQSTEVSVDSATDGKKYSLEGLRKSEDGNTFYFTDSKHSTLTKFTRQQLGETVAQQFKTGKTLEFKTKSLSQSSHRSIGH